MGEDVYTRGWESWGIILEFCLPHTGWSKRSVMMGLREKIVQGSGRIVYLWAKAFLTQLYIITVSVTGLLGKSLQQHAPLGEGRN